LHQFYKAPGIFFIKRGP